MTKKIGSKSPNHYENQITFCCLALSGVDNSGEKNHEYEIYSLT